MTLRNSISLLCQTLYSPFSRRNNIEIIYRQKTVKNSTFKPPAFVNFYTKQTIIRFFPQKNVKKYLILLFLLYDLYECLSLKGMGGK